MLFNVDAIVRLMDAVVYSDTKPQGDPPTRCREFDFGRSRNDPPFANLCQEPVAGTTSGGTGFIGVVVVV